MIPSPGSAPVGLDASSSLLPPLFLPLLSQLRHHHGTSTSYFNCLLTSGTPPLSSTLTQIILLSRPTCTHLAIMNRIVRVNPRFISPAIVSSTDNSATCTSS